MWLKDTLKKRQALIVKALPVYLDFLTMGVEAGLNMAGVRFGNDPVDSVAPKEWEAVYLAVADALGAR